MIPLRHSRSRYAGLQNNNPACSAVPALPAYASFGAGAWANAFSTLLQMAVSICEAATARDAKANYRNILPAEIREKLDLEGICFENDSYVPPDFTEYFSDLLTSVPVVDADDGFDL